MEMTSERISFILDPRDMLLSLQMGFSLIRAAVACAILERTSGLEPSPETTASRYLKLVTVPSVFFLLPLSLSGCHWRCLYQFGHLSTDLHLLPRPLSRLSTRASSSCSSSARASMYSAIGNISAAYTNIPIMFFQGITHDPFEKDIEKGG